MTQPDLTSVDTHFAFGENWKDFAAGAGREAVEQATIGLKKLFPNGELNGVSFFDIGSGSGLHMIAAKELGAAKVQGIDIDPNSVDAARMLLSRFLKPGDWAVREYSVFDLDPATDGLHDVVYSWGVLHHTGKMWTAIERAASLVAPSGYLCIALYRKTPMCGPWTRIKSTYAPANSVAQKAMRGVYKSIYMMGILATRRNPFRYLREYKSNRGMNWHHDVHDWMGGYPYESVEPAEITTFLDRLGFDIMRTFAKPAAVKGILGTHCDEFVAVRRSH